MGMAADDRSLVTAEQVAGNPANSSGKKAFSTLELERRAAYGLKSDGTPRVDAFTAPLEPSATDKLLQKASDPMKWLTQARNGGRAKSFLGGDAMGSPVGSSSILGSK